MILTSFSQEEYEQTIRDESYSDGKREGIKEGREQLLLELIRKKLEKGCAIEEIAETLEIEVTVVQKLVE